MLRLLIYGVPGTPIFEIAERLSEFHSIPFITIEQIPNGQDSYFDDKIPSLSFDTGDMSSGSEQQQMTRDPSALSKDKALDQVTSISGDYILLKTDELREIFDISQGIVVTEIPDTRLIGWATDVVFLNASDESAIDWFSKRRKCLSCGNVHHLEDKPPRVSGYCDRCGTELVIKEEDEPKNVRRQYMNWRKAFWRFKEISKRDKRFVGYSVDKYNNLSDLISRVNRRYRDSVEKPCWYRDVYKDALGGGM